jgi:hypothetical protein
MYSKTLSTAILFFLLSTTLSAQWNIVRETEQMMTFGNRPCFHIDFINADDDTVLDEWKTFVRKNFDSKVKKDRKSGEWVASDARANFVSASDFTIYAQIDKKDKNVSFNAWFDVGSGFLNSRDNPREARETADALRLFYYEVRRAVINEELAAAEKMLGEKESQLKRLERDNESLRKSIDDYKERIKKAEEDIVKNTKSQEATMVDIDAQKRSIEQIKMRIKNVENEGQ